MNPIEEFYRALELVEEKNRKRKPVVKEYRIYYNTDGLVMSLSETDHPSGENYIVVETPDVFYKNNTLLLRVVNNKLVILDSKIVNKVKLKKSSTGQPVVKGHAAVAVGLNEEYSEIEFYDRTNN